MHLAVMNFYRLRNEEQWDEEMKDIDIIMSEVSNLNLDNAGKYLELRKKLYDVPFFSEWGNEPDYQLFPKYIDDLKSFLFIQVFAASYEAMTSWVVQKETELFMKRYDYCIQNHKRIETAKMEKILFMGEIRYPNADKQYSDEKDLPKIIGNIVISNTDG
jgi:hypothetical protein